MAITTHVSEQEARKVAEAARETEWKLPSFGKELFLGRFRLDLLYPQPKQDPEIEKKGDAFLANLRAFLEEKVDPFQIERDAKIPDEVIQGLKDLGCLGVKIPEEYGGLGLNQVYYNRALVLAGSWHSSLSTLLSAHQSIGAPEPLRLAGTEEQKRKYLPLVARTHVSAFLLTEIDVGSDPARVGTAAIPTADGSGYVINGRKLWTTNGTIADVLVVMARVPKSDGHRGGITAFLVESGTPGITVEHRNAFMGQRGIENGVTLFQDVFVPTENVIGGEGLGLKIALATLNTGRLSLPAICAGTAKYSLKISREWSGERVQWGHPIHKHDAIAQKIAFIAGTAFALEAMLEISSKLADEKRNDVRIEAALAKLYSSEMAWLACDEMIQIRGGRGFETAESLRARGERPVPAEQVLRDLRINRIFEGSSEIMRLLIAREAVDQHLQVAGDIIDPEAEFKAKGKAALAAGKFYGKWFPTLTVGAGQKPGSFDEFGSLAGHLRFAERSSRKLARSTFYAMARWQGALEKKQSFLGRIVDIGCELFAITASCVHARTLADEDPSKAESAFELADLFCAQARRRIDRLFGDLWSNDDDDRYAAAQRVVEGRYTWFEEGILDPSGGGPMIPT
ncbi:MAG TPA: acyl-CoA dehydrogenase family protein [Sporichthyaceae bacterium]|nr:acyl-CoA dehydrogenase family protein [Sporichthyaceae bacterium]